MKRYGPDILEHVSCVVKNGAAQSISNEWKVHRESQILVEHQQRLAADWKSRYRIARTGVVERKTAQGRAAAGEEPFGKRDIAGNRVAIRRLYAKANRTREHQAASDRSVGRVLQVDPHEIGRRNPIGFMATLTSMLS